MLSSAKAEVRRAVHMPAPVTMIIASNFARAITNKLVGSIQGLTVDEIEKDTRTGEWLVSVSFWLPPPSKTSVAVVSPMSFLREKRLLRMTGTMPVQLISMKEQ